MQWASMFLWVYVAVQNQNWVLVLEVITLVSPPETKACSRTAGITVKQDERVMARKK